MTSNQNYGDLDMRGFSKSAKAIIKSSRALNKTVKHMVGPCVHLDNIKFHESINRSFSPNEPADLSEGSLGGTINIIGNVTEQSQYKTIRPGTQDSSRPQSPSTVASVNTTSPLPYVVNSNGGVDNDGDSSHKFSLEDFKSPFTSALSPAHVKIQGKLIPVSIVKDKIVATLRKHDSLSYQKTSPIKETSIISKDLNGSSSHDLLLMSPSAGSSLCEGGKLFESSSSQILKDIRLPFEGRVPQNASRSSVSEGKFGIDSNSFNRSLMSTSHRSKISSILRLEDDYAAKWMRMKEKRDQRNERQLRLQMRKDTIHTFRRVAFNTEKSELDRAIMSKKSLEQQYIDLKYQQARDKDAYHHSIYGDREEKILIQKTSEARQLRHAIQRSITASKLLIQRDTKERQRTLADKVGGSFALDSASSTIIDIPDEFVSRVKTAKSLVAYNAAKEELKNFHDQELIQRMNKLASAKQLAVKKADKFSSELIKTPIRSPQFFSDSITLEDESLLSNSKNLTQKSTPGYSKDIEKMSSLYLSESESPMAPIKPSPKIISVPISRDRCFSDSVCSDFPQNQTTYDLQSEADLDSTHSSNFILPPISLRKKIAKE